VDKFLDVAVFRDAGDKLLCGYPATGIFTVPGGKSEGCRIDNDQVFIPVLLKKIRNDCNEIKFSIVNSGERFLQVNIYPLVFKLPDIDEVISVRINPVIGKLHL
jgi:hypothetical protein